MSEKYNLTLKERVDFVNDVVDLASPNGVYEPALYDYALRIAAVAYFTDTNVNELNGEQLSDLAFSGETTMMMNEGPRKYILDTLNKACREKIEIDRQKYLAAFEAAAKNQPFTELLQLATEVLNGIGEQFDMNKMIEKIAEENEKKPVVDSSYRIKTPEGALDESQPINAIRLVSVTPVAAERAAKE